MNLRLLFGKVKYINPRRSMPWSIILTLCAVLILAQSIILAINCAWSSHPILGLRLQNKAISGLSAAHLDQSLEATTYALEAKPLTVTAGAYTTHVTPRQLGVTYDHVLLQRQILQTGRTGSFWHRITVQDQAVFQTQNVNLGFFRSDKVLAAKYLEAVDKQVRRKPVDAHFSFVSNTLSVVPDIKGYGLDKSEALADLTQIQTDKTQLRLPTQMPNSAILTSDLLPLLPEVKKILATPLTLSANDKEIVIPSVQLLDLLQPVQVPDLKQPSHNKTILSYNDVKLSQTLDQLASLVTVAPRPTIVNGAKVITRGSTGVHVDGTHAKVAMIAALEKRAHYETTAINNPPIDTLKIVTENVEPPVVSQYVQTINPIGQYPETTASGKMVYLTFDDGPGGYTENVLDTLKHYNVHAVFFVVGKNAMIYPMTMKRIVDEGHTLGNHSYTHADLAHLSSSVIQSELDKTQVAAKTTTGKVLDLFRPPYGSINDTVRAAAAKDNLSVMMWSVDPRDWAKPGVDVLVARVLNELHPGSNILLHSIHLQTSQALPAIIEGIRAKGYTLP